MKYLFYFILSIASILLVIILLASCSSQTPKFVNIAVPVKCSISGLPERPYLPIKDLKESSAPDIVMKAYVESLFLLDDYSDSLEGAIEACK